VHDICPKAGQIVMEYCEKLVGDCLDMPIELRLLALNDVAEALEYLNSQGLIHGDINHKMYLLVVKLMQSIS